MDHHFIDVYSTTLTPREPTVELLDAACEGNVIVCLCNPPGKTFIASKLTQHIINKADRNKGTLCLYVADSPSVVSKHASYFQRLTSMAVYEFHRKEDLNMGIWQKSNLDEIIVIETSTAVNLFKSKILLMSDVDLLILHGCHCILHNGVVPMKELMRFYNNCEKKPHVLSLVSNLFSSGLDLSQIESSVVKLEKITHCKAETASGVVSALRYGTQPHELVLEFAPHAPTEIGLVVQNEIMRALEFIRDHRYDPSEMYEGFMEELQNIPDPKAEPEGILLEFLNVLHELGVWCADRAALVLLLQLEKLKVTTPYERHFLLLCMTSSVLVKIRAILEDFFKSVNEKDRIYNYTSPKMRRVFEILKKFQPETADSDSEYSEASEGDVSAETLPASCPDSESKQERSDCDCELKTNFLLKRAQCPGLNDVTYEDFVSMIKNKKPSDKGAESKKSRADNGESPRDKTACDNQVTDSSKSVRKKNGYIPNENLLKLSMTGEEKINEVNTLENYLQYHEYLLLPKFRVDKNPRCDRFNGLTQVKGEDFLFRQMKTYGEGDPQLCGLIFVQNKLTAKVLFHVLNDLKQADENFSFLSVQFTVGKVVDGSKDPKGAESEHRKQELVLKRFRMRACNLLIGTSFLEEGIDLPKCNLVIRFDMPTSYRSYVNTKERARALDPLHCLLVDSSLREPFLERLGNYHEMEDMLLRMCWNLEPSKDEEAEADKYSRLIQPFCPLSKRNCPHVDLSTAISLVNRYCAKLPSDTFTRLTPIWSIRKINKFGEDMFVCVIRLPINSPVKQEIQGVPMPTRVLARRFAALQCCQILHSTGELDDTLQPITKESFWLREEEQLSASEDLEEITSKDTMEPRPGTTKRRQYYYKKIAETLTDCLPVAGQPSFLYDISMALTCPLPEEQNTRGRKIHPPEDASQGFGILTSKSIPKIGAFPIFTRSGEVQVQLQLAQRTVVLTESQIDKIVAFIHYTFTSVLRLQKYLMMFDPNSSENSYFIVPTKKGKKRGTVEVDWGFLELIYEKRNRVPAFVPEEERKNFAFDPAKFEDAVVSPWYRNQDQPQYLYVAEICSNLNPKSAFPGLEYDTFEEYYLKKYNIQIQNTDQALLDVDHTSARLNFLTPRYVNRKGVALPTTSEEKKRAKRENLKQKQILVPELCDIHPFPATLWRKAVCLPCILHRINALLLADQVRRIVATEIGVGSADLQPEFDWEPLNFGWSLADVLKQAKSTQKQEEEEKKGDVFKSILRIMEKKVDKHQQQQQQQYEEDIESDGDNGEKGPLFEIGTWSNEMAYLKPPTKSLTDSSEQEESLNLLKNITMIEKEDINGLEVWNTNAPAKSTNEVRYSSPTDWLGNTKTEEENLTDFLSDTFCSDDDYSEYFSSDSESECGGLKIEFTEDNVAEAVEKHRTASVIKELTEMEPDEPWDFEPAEDYSEHVKKFTKNLERRRLEILNSGKFFGHDKPFNFFRPSKASRLSGLTMERNADGEGEPFGSPDNRFPKLVNDLPEEVKNLPHTDLILKSLAEEEVRGNRKLNNIPNGICLVGDTFKDNSGEHFSFDDQPNLEGHPGPSPSLILQALTMSNANDGINLERLETIGDSFLKYAITTYLYCVYENVHEGKLSHLRSKQVSNFNLYRLGRRKILGESMIATKFEPHDNWLPPCYYVPRELERALIEAGVPASHWNRADLPSLRNLSKEEICRLVKEKGEQLGIVNSEKEAPNAVPPSVNEENIPCFIPYNLMTQHSIPDKSIADCVEALIGAYLVACGPRGALLFMSWLGLKVLPKEEKFFKSKDDLGIRKGVGCSLPVKVTADEEVWSQVCFGKLNSLTQPLLRHVENPEGELEKLLRGFNSFEESIGYTFRDRSYLLQALTHASYSPNRLTDCYQRLEFLGDAVLDYLITRHLYEDPRHHSPGALTDLRSALVNNTIFASLAVRHNYHKYFRHMCPGLNEVVDRFVRIQQENGHLISEEFYLIEEDDKYEFEEAEDVEVPKALGDIFESVAGAIFLDSGMSLDAVWRVYFRIMKREIEQFSAYVPKSPIRELFELEPETAQFGKPEKLADGKRVRVSVEVFGKGIFNGIGRNYRIAKGTAAKCALMQLKRKGLLEKRK